MLIPQFAQFDNPANTVMAARQQFGALQHQTFPVYFNMSIALAGGLMALWSFGHPSVLSNLTNPRIADVAQFYALGSVAAAQGVNQLIVGPLTSKYVVCS